MKSEFCPSEMRAQQKKEEEKKKKKLEHKTRTWIQTHTNHTPLTWDETHQCGQGIFKKKKYIYIYIYIWRERERGSNFCNFVL